MLDILNQKEYKKVIFGAGDMGKALAGTFPTAWECFVDCGCFDGDTSKNFIKWCNNQYSHIYGFEPEYNKIDQCKSALGHDKVDIYNLGIWSQKDELHFSGNLGASSYIGANGKQVIQVDSLDNILEEKRVTFIKMDIEGAEIEALRGGKNF